MFEAILGGLLAGWILNLFGFHYFIGRGIYELTGYFISINVYYLACVVISLVGTLSNSLMTRKIVYINKDGDSE